MTKRSIDTPPPGEGPAPRERKPRRFGALFHLEGRLDGGERGLWHVRVYLSQGRWWISARRHRKHRVWILSAEDGFTAAVREAIRRELGALTGLHSQGDSEREPRPPRARRVTSGAPA